MRIPSSVFAVGRYALALVVITGSVVLMSAPKKTVFTPHDKAYYASDATVNFVRPGLTLKVVSATIAQDGTISVDYKITDPNGLPLDPAGITTPGAVSVSFVCAYIPKGQTQFYSYATRAQTSPITNVTAIQAGADSGGTTKQVADGEFIYTFKTKAVGANSTAYDPTATHRVGIYGSRNLTEFDLGTNYASNTLTWIPAGGTPTNTRDVVRTASCNKCHDSLSFHGGSRIGMDLCIMCHQPQTVDPDTGNTLDMKVFVHKIHMGSQLPSVIAGKPYQIIGFNQAVSDWSTVVLPSDPRRCTFCHEDVKVTGATQSNNWLTNPSRAACGACHDDVNFATGQNHVNLPQVSDSQCTQCHIPQGELEFDASIKGAHTVPTQSLTNPGLDAQHRQGRQRRGRQGSHGDLHVERLRWQPGYDGYVDRRQQPPGPGNGRSDHGLRLHQFRFRRNHAGLRIREPGTDAKCANDGTCTYTFTHAVPAKATGTYAIGIEGRRGSTLLAGTAQQQTSEYGAINKVSYFSVDGSKVAPRRTGGGRQQVQRLPQLPFAARRKPQPDRNVRAVPQPERERYSDPQCGHYSVRQESATASHQLRHDGPQDPHGRDHAELQPDLHHCRLRRQP